MKDIDFDELDRAVSSLMGSVPAQSAETPRQAVAATRSNSVPAVASPSASLPSEETQSVAVRVETKPKVTPSVPARSGRFMDMKPRTAAERPVAPVVSRTGPDIAPVETPSVAAVSPVVEIKSTVSEPQVDVSEVTAPVDALTDKVDHVDQTEHVDLPEESVPVTITSSATPAPSTSTISFPEPEAATEVAPETEVPSLSDPSPVVTLPPREEADTTGSDSPFVSGAKVEKRPLNAQSDAPLESLLNEDTSSTSDQAAIESLKDELKQDILSVESNDLNETTKDLAEPPVSKPESPAASTVTSAASTAQIAPSSSIAQQYREQPSSGDQDHAAIYDVSQYPEPLHHPAKKKQSWLWVLWVLLLLAIGAGGAVALYLANII